MERAASHPFATSSYLLTFVKIHWAALLVAAGDPARRARGAALAREVIDTKGASAGYRAWASNLIAEQQMEEGDLAAAEATARAALDPSSVAVVRRLLAVATLARILARRGAAAEAIQLCEDGLAWLSAQRVEGYAELPLRLALVEARLAAGDASGAGAALEKARARIEARARAIPDPEKRALYLTASVEAKWAARLLGEG
jgi:hypothetical protein